MHAKTKNNTHEIVSPPLPPAPVFSEQQMATARPVQPLPPRQWRKSAGIFQHIIIRQITAVAAMGAAAVICVAIAAASAEWPAPLPATQEESAQSVSESTPQPTAPVPVIAAPGKRQVQRRHNFSNRRARDIRRMLPPLDSDEEFDDSRARPRLVSVIH